MTLQFPIPDFVGQVVRYQGKVWAWDGIGWHIDDVASRLDLSMIPAYLGQFVHVLKAGETSVNLSERDIYGATYALAQTPPFEGIKVYGNGVLLVADDGTGTLGEYTVNRPANSIDFIAPVGEGDIIHVGVLMTPDALAPGRVDVMRIKDLDTDWVTDPDNPTQGMIDGTRRVFDLLVDIPGEGQQFAVLGNSIELALVSDGNRLQPDVDYVVVGSRLTMTVAPRPGVPLWALWYRPAGAAGSGAIDPPQPPLDSITAFYGWRPGEGPSWQDSRGVAVTVPNAPYRTSLRPTIDLVAGRLVMQADTGEMWQWSGSAWERQADAGTFAVRRGGRAQILRSSTALARPGVGDGLPGQLWVNMADRMIGWFEDDGDPIDLFRVANPATPTENPGSLVALDANGLVDRSFLDVALRAFGNGGTGANVVTNWNNAHTGWTAAVQGSATAANRPSDASYAGFYIRITAQNGVLIVSSPENSLVFIRSRLGGVWGDWQNITQDVVLPDALLRQANLSDLPSVPSARGNLQVMAAPRPVFDGDLNELQEPGLYMLGIGVTNGWLNDGTGTGGEATAGDVVIHAPATGGVALQLGLNSMPSAPAVRPLRMRFRTAGGVWAPWVSLMTAAEVSAAIGAALAALPPSTAIVGPTAPANPINGQFWYRTTAPAGLNIWVDGSPGAWLPSSAVVDAPPGVHIGDAPPATPKEGQLWFKTVEPVGLYIWYRDADSSQWVSVGSAGGGGGSSAPTSVAIVKGSSGWQVVGDRLFCWGSGVTPSGAAAQVTFPKAFKTTPSVSAIPISATGARRTSHLFSVTPTTASVVCLDEANTIPVMSFSWIAVGEALDVDKMPKEVQIPGGGGGGGSGSLPIGTIALFAANSIPPGWLLCDNQRVTTVYPDLRRYLLDAGSPFGEIGGDPRVPELRGEFMRGFSAGRAGVDAGRVFGSAQADEIKSHKHDVIGQTVSGSGPAGTAQPQVQAGNTFRTTDTTLVGGTETRPRNVALLPCIRAFAATVVEGQANFGIATTAEARAGTRSDVVMTPATVRALSGGEFKDMTGLGNWTFTYPIEANEIDVILNGFNIPANGQLRFRFASTPLARCWHTRTISGASGINTAGADNEDSCLIDAAGAAVMGYSGVLSLVRRAPGSSWGVRMDGRRSTTAMVAGTAIFNPMGGPDGLLNLFCTAPLVLGNADLRWRI